MIRLLVCVIRKQLDEETLHAAWTFVNDSFLHSDMCLLFPPYLIALASLQVSLIVSPHGASNMDRFKTWLTGECAAERVHYRDVRRLFLCPFRYAWLSRGFSGSSTMRRRNMNNQHQS